MWHFLAIWVLLSLGLFLAALAQWRFITPDKRPGTGRELATEIIFIFLMTLIPAGVLYVLPIHGKFASQGVNWLWVQLIQGLRGAEWDVQMSGFKQVLLLVVNLLGVGGAIGLTWLLELGLQ